MSNTPAGWQVVLAVAAVLIAGCGGRSDASGTTTPSAGPTATLPPSPAPAVLYGKMQSDGFNCPPLSTDGDRRFCLWDSLDGRKLSLAYVEPLVAGVRITLEGPESPDTDADYGAMRSALGATFGWSDNVTRRMGSMATQRLAASDAEGNVAWKYEPGDGFVIVVGRP